MADSAWIWWIMTCGISLYFVMLLLDFNKPSKKLMEQIDHQETRRRDMEQKHLKVQEDVTQIKSRQDDLDLQMEELEERRKDLFAGGQQATYASDRGRVFKHGRQRG